MLSTHRLTGEIVRASSGDEAYVLRPIATQEGSFFRLVDPDRTMRNRAHFELTGTGDIVDITTDRRPVVLRRREISPNGETGYVPLSAPTPAG